jgi:hypothetical protein
MIKYCPSRVRSMSPLRSRPSPCQPSEQEYVFYPLILIELIKILKYTVTMFLVDVSKSMGNTRTVELPPGPNGEERTTEMTNLEWALQFVKLKIQEMVSDSAAYVTK